MSQTFVPHPLSLLSAFPFFPKEIRQQERKANFILILPDDRLLKVQWRVLWGLCFSIAPQMLQVLGGWIFCCFQSKVFCPRVQRIIKNEYTKKSGSMPLHWSVLLIALLLTYWFRFWTSSWKCGLWHVSLSNETFLTGFVMSRGQSQARGNSKCVALCSMGFYKGETEGCQIVYLCQNLGLVSNYRSPEAKLVELGPSRWAVCPHIWMLSSATLEWWLSPSPWDGPTDPPSAGCHRLFSHFPSFTCSREALFLKITTTKI